MMNKKVFLTSLLVAGVSFSIGVLLIYFSIVVPREPRLVWNVSVWSCADKTYENYTFDGCKMYSPCIEAVHHCHEVILNA